MSAKTSKGCVLCIDDEPHVLRALQWLLKKDFEVYTAENAADALRLLRKHDFDVVVSDQRMPGITGVEFLRHVRKLAPRAMRILLTGYSDLDAMVSSVNESEVYRFITKPWDVKGLPQLIADAAQVAREEAAVPAEADVVDMQPTVVPTASLAVETLSVAAPPAFAPVPGVTVQPVAAAAAVPCIECVLVIDDSQELHAMAEQVLQDTASVLHAFDLPTALDILGTRKVSVIVSEVQVDGLDATRLLRMIRHKHPQIVTLVLSGQRDAEIVKALINQGQVFRIVPKPVKPAFIRLIVEAALKRHRELIARPSVQRRFAVEKTAPEVAESLFADVVKASAASVRPEATVRADAFRMFRPRAPAALAIQAGPFSIAVNSGADAQVAHGSHDESFVASLRAGFRRLFGT